MTTAKRMTSQELFETYLMAPFPLIALDSVEIDRATKMVEDWVASYNKLIPELEIEDPWVKANGMSFFVWDGVNGVHRYTDSKQGPRTIQKIAGTEDPVKALGRILEGPKGIKKEIEPGVYVFQNLHMHMTDDLAKPYFVHILREILHIGEKHHIHIVMIGDTSKIPTEVQRDFVSIDFPLPTRDELEVIINNYTTKDIGITFKPKEVKEVAEAAVGMTEREVKGAVRVAVVTTDGASIDKDIVFEEKAAAVKRGGMLELLHTTESMATVGGLPKLKEWCGGIAEVFKDFDGSRKFGLDVPKGILLTGLQGAGKTLSAKALASLLGLKIYRVDIGNVFGSLVGETERKTRELFKFMDAAAPAVFLFDEADKAFTGLESSGASDAGIKAGVIGSFLYYLEEKTTPAFIVATANNIKNLPPELIRKGRWDAIMFVDAPGDEEREEIFQIHLNKTGRNIKDFEAKLLINASEGYTGAEIRSVIQDALRVAFKENKRKIHTDDLLLALENTVPLTRMRKEEIKAMRDWAKTSAIIANAPVSGTGHWGDDAKPAKVIRRKS